jgi:hypothetical protein
MIWPIVLLIATPFLIGVCGLVVRNRQTFDVLHCVQAGIMVISSILLVEEVSGGGPVSFLVFLRVAAVYGDWATTAKGGNRVAVGC